MVGGQHPVTVGVQFRPVRFYQRPEGALITRPSQREQRVTVIATACLVAHQRHYIDPPRSLRLPSLSRDLGNGRH